MPLEIVAEIHPQHGGSQYVARELIRAAKLGGATVAKFQLYDAGSLLGSAWEYLEATRDDLLAWKRWCDEEEIEFMASVFDEERVEWCEDAGVRRYKLASRTVVEGRALCERVIALGKETLISLGAWAEERKPFGENPKLRYLYCKSKYPALLEDLDDFPRDFAAAGLAGYSDHSLGIATCLLAVARGGVVIEKHLTLDKMRTRETERAHVCSMTPDELLSLSQIGGALYRARAAIETAASRQAAGPGE